MDTVTESSIVRFEIAKLELKRGDVLAVRVPLERKIERIQQIVKQLASELPDGVRFIVYTDDIEMSVIRNADQPT